MRPAGRTSRRRPSALGPAGLALLAFGLAGPLAPGPARGQDAGDPSPASATHSHTRAYVAFGAGAALTGLSFVLAEKADRDYERYLAETDPARLEDHYQAARRGDRLAAASLIAGQAGLALGVYWRFLRHPREAKAGTRTSWNVAPRLGREGAGVAFDVHF